jgi:hypothetical protein
LHIESHQIAMTSSSSSSSDNGNSSKRGDPAQIPKEDVSGEVEKVISEQGGVEGQRKEVNVESYSKTASLGQILKDLDFPANKDNIVQFVRQKSPNSDLLSSLQNIEDRQYQNVSEVAKAAGIVY